HTISKRDWSSDVCSSDLEILEKFERGVTLLDVRGGYKKDPKEMLMVVISEREITAMQEMITQHDEDAFVVFMSASDVLGRGFSRSEERRVGKGCSYDRER